MSDRSPLPPVLLRPEAELAREALAAPCSPAPCGSRGGPPPGPR